MSHNGIEYIFDRYLMLLNILLYFSGKYIYHIANKRHLFECIKYFLSRFKSFLMVNHHSSRHVSIDVLFDITNYFRDKSNKL